MVVIDRWSPENPYYCPPQSIILSTPWSTTGDDLWNCYLRARELHKREEEMMNQDCMYADNEKYRLGGGLLVARKVIFNPPATIVIWEDGTKTVVKCMEGDTYDAEKGLALCYMKKSVHVLWL